MSDDVSGVIEEIENLKYRFEEIKKHISIILMLLCF